MAAELRRFVIRVKLISENDLRNIRGRFFPPDLVFKRNVSLVFSSLETAAVTPRLHVVLVREVEIVSAVEWAVPDLPYCIIL